ncbi:nitronate monooxygenase [Chryseotalea sanaruensis]|uniref:Nitronate monooxygenase n=1 Tax=Chryseotalea sanaruensis TaxID=2482724 RepID=A0A401U7W5_9BACT|nr:nitronate monooxygenase [Chryseotalea sanaruensis]GCC50988.1 nitronate monooxygenase [Chryseotalea sanaruensis]
MNQRIQQLFNIEFPIIQAGMIWCSGWRLAAAVSNAGGLGIIGAGSMHPETLKEHLQKCKAATTKPFAVNVPMLYPEMKEIIDLIIQENVKIVFTSAGNPATWTSHLKAHGITVVHVVSSVKFAKKAELAGVDAVVAEGFEAGGHNGREETTTLVLIPMVREAISIPLIAAGGVANGRSMLAAEALGADGVQIGSRFAASAESSAHQNFKNKIVAAGEGETLLTMKKLTPVRLLRNKFFQDVIELEKRGGTSQEMEALLGKRRAKKGMFEGDMEEGELEIGQVAASINKIQPAAEIVREIWEEYLQVKKSLCG